VTRLVVASALVVLAGAAVFGAGEGAATARATAAPAPSAVSVSMSASACRVNPARIPAGAVRFTLNNRSRVAQRFAIAHKTSAFVAPGGRLRYLVALDDPSLYSYRCVPRRGRVRSGDLRVAHNIIVETDMDASDAMGSHRCGAPMWWWRSWSTVTASPLSHRCDERAVTGRRWLESQTYWWLGTLTAAEGNHDL
jgi:hypothetical protein